MKRLLLLIGVVSSLSATADPGPRFAMVSSKGPSKLLIPLPDNDTATGFEKLADAFCEESGKLPIKFEAFQNTEAQQSNDAMPFDARLSFTELRGARYRVLKGKPKTEERCLVVSAAYAQSREFLHLKDVSPDAQRPCDRSTTKKVKAGFKPPLKACRSVAVHKSLLALELDLKKPKGAQYTALLTDRGLFSEQTQDPTDDYGYSRLEFILGLRAKTGETDVLNYRFHHETILYSLDRLVGGTFKPIMELKFYNGGG